MKPAIQILPALMVSAAFLPVQASHLTVPVQGGMPGLPLMTDIHMLGTNLVVVRWDGPSGLYRLMGKLDITNSQWELRSPWTVIREATVTAMNEREFFSVLGPSPNYAGSVACAECHPDVHETEMDTQHADAFETLKLIGQSTNSSCLPCHTVGYNLPTGFTTEAATPHLRGVQCENCHGPAGFHGADPFNLTYRPRVEIAGQMCGGCHTDSHHPTYDEWSLSGHAAVSAELKEDFEGPIGEDFYIPSCGGCHSASVRQALLSYEPLPDGHEASAVGIVCTTCHDPHESHVWTNVISGTVTTNQLLYPAASLEDYHHAMGNWDSNYNANISACGQCHNDRNATWENTSEPPHHSPQYNMLLGTVGVLPDDMSPWPATHAGSRFFTNDLNNVVAVTNQCVTCHLQTEAYESDEQPAVMGHRFEVESFEVCMACHVDPEGLADLVRMMVSERIVTVKSLLDVWGAGHSPELLRTNYGALAWEYTNSGDLSEGSGPSWAEQPLIPEGIQKARFNLYLVLYDGSLGIHNLTYSLDLLDAAYDWVLAELPASMASPASGPPTSHTTAHPPTHPAARCSITLRIDCR